MRLIYDVDNEAQRYSDDFRKFWARVRASVADGSAPLQRNEGRVLRVFMTGHNDFPEFELEEDGKTSTWPRYGDPTTYVVGRHVVIERLMHKITYLGQSPETVVRVWIGDAESAP